METDPYARLHQMLGLTHEVLRRGCRQIELHAATVAEPDVPAFVGYCVAFARNLAEHHDLEEQVLFPALKDKVTGLATRHDEHEKLAEALKSFTTHLYSLDATLYPTDAPAPAPSKLAFSSSAFLAAFSPIRDVVVPHMTSEDGDMSPATLRGNGVEEETVRSLIREMGARGKATDRSMGLAFMLVHWTGDERAVFFGNVPWFVRDYVFPTFTLWNSAYWKYASTEK
ncbi:hypothetical protein DFJ73DRAFT_865411 [Zopfochytrium polystomum]|nr:hypothetical protein DFJ73DRAFT_865411 [Zopfochytrium polystomum]